MTTHESTPLPYHFDDATRGVVIHRPDLPAAWINYLSNGALHAFVSQAGGGLAWWRSPLSFRLTRYRFNAAPPDSPGFSLYVREADGTAWSPAWRPTEMPLDDWRATHRPGHSRFDARRRDLACSLELFIPPGENALIWDVRLRNTGAAPVTLDLFAYVEFSLLDWIQDQQWEYYVRHALRTWFDAAAGAVFYLYHHFYHTGRVLENPLVWFAASEAPTGFDADRDAFLGPYRSERNPRAVEAGACTGSEMRGGEPAAALQHKITLAAGEEKRLHYFLGAEDAALSAWPASVERARAALERLRGPGAVDRLSVALDAWWDEHLAAFTLGPDFPDPDCGRMIAVWNPVQCVHTGRYSRSISSQATGIRGLGFRDTAQDMLAIAYRKPDWAAEMFLLLLAHQFEDGHAAHQFFPGEGRPAEVDHPRCDNHLWLPLLAHAIVAETGDSGLIGRAAPFLAEDGLAQASSATVWEHLVRGLRFTADHLGEHGLPLILHGDWNDSIWKLSLDGRGESVFAGQQAVYAAGLLLALGRAAGAPVADMAWLEEFRGKLTAALAACAWDGAWFRRGYDGAGGLIGSAACEHGQIWLNAQSWAVISNTGTDAQQRQAMDSAHHLLGTGIGLKKIHPSFPSFPETMQPYSGYAAGCGENGAVFCHANTWAIIADALLGAAERAWELYRQLLPHRALQHVGLDRYQAEPYAYVSNIVGPENPKFGWTNVNQVSGTAAWMDIAATQYLLGIRPELDGLRLDPRLPVDWPGFTATRRYRGCRVELTVTNGPGRPRLWLDGAEMPDNLIPASALAGRGSIQAHLEF